MGRLLLYVNIIGTVTYYLLKHNIGYSALKSNGNPMYAARYAEWITTCPSLILLLGELANEQASSHKIAGIDTIMLVFGFLGALPDPYGPAFGLISLSIFFIVMRGILGLFTAALGPDSNCIVDRKSLLVARVMTFVCWTLFPVIHFAVELNLVTYYTGEALFSIADLGF